MCVCLLSNREAHCGSLSRLGSGLGLHRRRLNGNEAWNALKMNVASFFLWSQTYVADIFMSQSWKDNRLLIPPNINFNVNASANPHGPYRLLPLALIDKIWRPDSFFKVRMAFRYFQ